MACDDSPGAPSCSDHPPAALNLFIPILLVCVLFALGTGMICRRFGYMGRRPMAGGLAFDVDDSFHLDNGPNFGETPKIYDFSMMRDIGGDASAHWAALFVSDFILSLRLPISAHHIEDQQGTQDQEKIGTAAMSSPGLPTSFRLHRFWEPKPSNRLSEEQHNAEQPVDVSTQPVSTSILIAMPRYGKVSPNAESEGLPDIVLGIAEVHVSPSLSQSAAKTI
ncbi:hypothetical protein FRC04_001537 [Tulasnella sp. 424]|nr:hypothetical protein FRC04_001537 [Tulasnella sp. 424]KAG8969082.1 hypothetical protein FRC05_001235 [Tulasnella sp. 425]